MNLWEAEAGEVQHFCGPFNSRVLANMNLSIAAWVSTLWRAHSPVPAPLSSAGSEQVLQGMRGTKLGTRNLTLEPETMAVVSAVCLHLRVSMSGGRQQMFVSVPPETLVSFSLS